MAVAGNSSGAGGARNLARSSRRRPAVTPRPAAPVGRISAGVPKLEKAPGAGAARQAQRKARQARPAPVVPQIPIVAHPTRQQALVATRTVRNAIHAHAQRTGQSVQQAAVDLKRDPRAAQLVKASRHYSVALAHRNEEAIGHALGGRTVQQQREMGRKFIAYHNRSDTVHPGKAPAKVKVGVGPAAVTLSVGAVARGTSRLVEGATSLDTGDLGPRRVFGKVARDVASLGTSPIITGYEVGRGLADVATGKGTGRLVQTAKAVGGSVAEEVRHPVKYAGEHPLLAALTVAGGVGAAGRVAGATARGLGSKVTEGGARGALARVGAVERSPLALGSDLHSPRVERRASKDVTRKAVQSAADELREPLRSREGHVVMQQMPSGQYLPVLKARPRERERLLKQREANFRSGRANAEERYVRDRISHEFAVRGVKGRAARDLVSMVVEGTISSAPQFEKDLRRHGDRISGQLRRENVSPGSVYRHPGEKASAETRLKTVQAALSSPKVLAQKDRIVSTGVDIGRRLNEMEREAVRLGILNPKRAARSRLVVPAVEHLDARHFTGEELAQLGETGAKALKHGSLRHPDGKFLSSQEIEDALRAKGRDPETVAYLPHRFDVRGRRAFHTQFRPGSRPIIDKPGTRTGAAYAKGATSADPELIREQASRLATQTVKTGHVDRLIHDMGLNHESGRPFTRKEADEVAQRLQETTGERYVPVSAFPAKLGKEAKAAARREQGTQAEQTLQAQLLNRRLAVGTGAKNVVLMPAPVVEQLLKHLQPPGAVEKFFQALNPAFRLAVLPQFRWLTGNFIEPYLIRLPAEGSGVVNLPGMAMDVIAARRTLKVMRESTDPATRRAAQMLESQQLGQGLFIGGRGASVRRDLEEFGRAGKAAAFFRDLPVMKQAKDLALMLPHSFFALNRVVESGAQHAAFGRLARREIQSFTGSWVQSVALQRASMQELARGLTGTATQARFMREQYRILGQYEGFSPGLRRMVQSVTPFIPWYLNALRFAFWTMPVHHTALAALAAQTGETFRKDFEQMHTGTPPGSLRLAVPSGDGGWIDLARYTPYGAGEEQLGGAATWQSVVSQFAPQLQGAISVLTGTDPFGRPLQVPKDAGHPQGKPTSAAELLPIAANQLAGSVVPGYSTVQRLREQGGTPYATSTPFSPKVKPGTQIPQGPGGLSPAVNRTLNPLRPTYLKAPSKGTGGTAHLDPAVAAVREEMARRAAATAVRADPEVQRVREALARSGH